MERAINIIEGCAQMGDCQQVGKNGKCMNSSSVIVVYSIDCSSYNSSPKKNNHWVVLAVVPCIRIIGLDNRHG